MLKLASLFTAATLGLAAMSGAQAAGAQAKPLNLTLSGGSPGGLWSLLGAGIDRALKAEDPASVVTYQATGGGLANIGLLDRGTTDLGLVHDAELKIALRGEPPFRAPVTTLRAIGYMYDWAPVHFFIRRDLAEQQDIHDIADLASLELPLRVGVNRPGNIAGLVALRMLEHAGLSVRALEARGGRIVRADGSDQATLMRDGRIDVVTNAVFVLHSSLRTIQQNVDVALLDVPAEVIAATNEEFGTSPFVIPAGSYEGQTRDVPTLSLGAVLVAPEALPDATVYALTRGLISQIDALRSVHPSMARLTPAVLARPGALQFHPGARRAYEDAGLLR